MPYKDPADWKRWRDRNIVRQREKERVYQAAYRENNREADRAKYQRYYEAHKDDILARKRAWKKSEAGRAWFETYREQHAQNVKRYVQTEEGRQRHVLTEARRRGRKANAGGTTSYEQLMARIEFYGGRCYLCGADWQQVDHVIPLAKGGSNWPANLRPICSSCNVRKSARPLEEVSRTRLTAVSA